MIYKKTKVADAVLAVFQALYDSEERNFGVEPYMNGREAGWKITDWNVNRSAVFAENRNSDDIVVYVGDGFLHFTMQGNIPDEETYQKRKFFNWNDFTGAADYIYNFLSKDKPAL